MSLPKSQEVLLPQPDRWLPEGARPDPYPPCHDCEVEEGQIHHPGCDMERCPICGTQRIGCQCLPEEKAALPPVSYIVYPPVCARCGKLWYRGWMVADEVWEKYIEPAHREDGLCWGCFLTIKRLIDEGARQ